MTKMAITVNGAESCNLYPAFILSTSALAWDCEVVLFFTPRAAQSLRPGFLEGLSGKGLPDMATLVSDFIELGGQILLCELALENQDLTPDDLREDVKIVNAPSFIHSALDATLTFSF